MARDWCWLLGLCLLVACGQATPTLVPTTPAPAIQATPNAWPVPSKTPLPHPYPFPLATPVALLPSATPRPYPFPRRTPTDLPPPTATGLPRQIIWQVTVQTVTHALPTEFATPAPAALPYEIRCEDNSWRLVHWPDEALINRFSAATCPMEVVWAPDQTIAALSTTERDIFLWAMDGSAPIKIVRWEQDDWNFTASPRWSPNSQQFGFTLMTVSEDIWPPTKLAWIVNRAGQVVATFPIAGGGDGEDLGWLTNDIVCQGARMSSPCHRATTGEFLFGVQGWHVDAAGAYLQQRPSLSPNGAWALLDHTMFGDVQSNFTAAIWDSYQLYDLVQARPVYTLPNNNGHTLAFSGWSANSTTAYLIHGHSRTNLLTEPVLPQGLLAFDVQTQQLQLLFPGAEMVRWRPDQQWAFLVFAASNTEGPESLWGGVWQPGLENAFCQTKIANTLIYADPAWAEYFSQSPFGEPSWSHNGEWVAFGDTAGGLHLCNINGQAVQVAQDASGDSWLGVQLVWAPNDAHLLVQYGAQAWVVSIPPTPH